MVLAPLDEGKEVAGLTLTICQYLYISANKEGYWNSFHMSIQFEDVVDCLQVLSPEFVVVLLFDHSQVDAQK